MWAETNDNQSEIPKKEFQYIQDWYDKRIQDRLGEMVGNRFEYSYIDFAQIWAFGVKIWVSEKWEIRLQWVKAGLKFSQGGYIIPRMLDHAIIPEWATFRVLNSVDWKMNIEVHQKSYKPYIIQIEQKKPE